MELLADKGFKNTVQFGAERHQQETGTSQRTPRLHIPGKESATGIQATVNQMTKWYKITDFYRWDDKKLRHSQTPVTKWVKLNCVYKIRVGDKVVHVGRSDTCKKHGPAEKVRKAIIQLLRLEHENAGVSTTKLWRGIRLKYRPNSSNISIGVIETNAIAKTYLQEAI